MIDGVELYRQALADLQDLEVSVAAQRDQEQVSAALMRLRIAVVRAYDGRQPRRPGRGARSLLLTHFQRHLGAWLHGEELAAVSGIGEWARRVRELRLEDGYRIEESAGRYRLIDREPDVARRDRWRVVGEVQSLGVPAFERVRTLVTRLVERVVTIDELDRVAGDRSGGLLIRELRGQGWPIESATDAPDLRGGEFRLAGDGILDVLGDDQAWFSEDTRAAVFARDRFRCTACGLDHEHAAGSGSFFLLVRRVDTPLDEVPALSSRQLSELFALVTVCNRCAANGV